ncbi:isopentenyl-diphosphate delta-isomerase [archaeon BMS3Abin16]|nr:isopentenyl-diphosphate delta-isomerase [archaeon BMS3Abin16]
MALPLLGAAMKSPDAVIEVLNRVIEELKIAMFLMGAGSVSELRQCDLVITGRTREWLKARDIDYKKYANRKDL